MKDTKGILRYLGFQTLSDGGRGFDFSFETAGATVTSTTVLAPVSLFTGSQHLAIQESAGICYETVRWRIENDEQKLPARFTLTSSDILQHRKTKKRHGRRQALSALRSRV